MVTLCHCKKNLKRLAVGAHLPKKHISVYGLDFDNCYIIFTDLDGKTPVDAKAPVVAACYDDRDAFMWGKELKDFAALKALRAAHADNEAFIAAVENYTLPKE